MFITVLNYNIGEIDIIYISPKFKSEVEGNIEDFLSKKSYNLDEISYMVHDSIKINNIIIDSIDEIKD